MRRPVTWILLAAALLAAIVFAPALLATLASAWNWVKAAYDWPTAAELSATLLLRNYNTRVVVLGTACLGAAAGMTGSFMLLRKRALLGDALSHATYPGVGAAFMIMVVAGGGGKSLPGLLTGAVVGGVAGLLTVLLIRGATRLKEDAALGIVLSVFFGFGVALDGMIQQMPAGSAAGLPSFIYGKTASMVAVDAWMIAATAVAVAVICILLFKELTLLCFDSAFARQQGWPTTLLDLVLMALVTVVTVLGLQAVGLILIVALLIIPPAAARFWTERLPVMFAISAGVGFLSGYVGGSISALVSGLPAGATIVLLASALFLISMLFGSRRGAVPRWIGRARLVRRVAMQHLLRAAFERIESTAEGAARGGTLPVKDLLAARSWPRVVFWRLLRRAQREGLLVFLDRHHVRLTDEGRAQAARMTRNHRLWEIYLIRYADVALNHVDRDADAIEHVLGRDIVDELEALLAREQLAVPVSPHPVAVPAKGAGDAL